MQFKVMPFCSSYFYSAEDAERAEYEVFWNEMLKIQRTAMGSQHSSRYNSFGFWVSSS